MIFSPIRWWIIARSGPLLAEKSSVAPEKVTSDLSNVLNSMLQLYSDIWFIHHHVRDCVVQMTLTVVLSFYS